MYSRARTVLRLLFMSLTAGFAALLQPQVAESAVIPRTALSLREYVSEVNPKYKWYRHCEVLCEVLQSVADGERKRVMVFMPPRHGKSELVSRSFPAYHLARHPDKWVGLNSYAADLAYTFSRSSRDAYQRAGGIVRDDSAAVKHWQTNYDGGLWAAGVGGPITGKGFHLGLIDDPIKNAQEAMSEVIREGHKQWYDSTFYTREEPNGAIVLVQTRWHEDDLAGYLLSKESQGEEPEKWHVVNFEALKSGEAQKFPVTCTVEPDKRKVGEALCPERYSAVKLRTIQARVGSYTFGALYQQRPTAAQGVIFKRQWWKFYTIQDHPIKGVPTLPKSHRVIQSWDCAFKDEATSDFVSGQAWCRTGTNIYLIDRIKERLSFSATCEAMLTMRGKHKSTIATYIEDKANGSAIIDTLRRQIPGIVAVEPDGGKVARAYAVQPLVEAGNVYLPHPEIAPWVEDFIRELAQFPRGANDDDVDACTQALNQLAWDSDADNWSDEVHGGYEHEDRYQLPKNIKKEERHSRYVAPAFEDDNQNDTYGWTVPA